MNSKQRLLVHAAVALGIVAIALIAGTASYKGIQFEVKPSSAKDQSTESVDEGSVNAQDVSTKVLTAPMKSFSGNPSEGESQLPTLLSPEAHSQAMNIINQAQSLFSPRKVVNATISSVIVTVFSLIVMVGIIFAAYQLSAIGIGTGTVDAWMSTVLHVSMMTGALAIIPAIALHIGVIDNDHLSRIITLVGALAAFACILSVCGWIALDFAKGLLSSPLFSMEAEPGFMSFFHWFFPFIHHALARLSIAAIVVTAINAVYSLLVNTAGADSKLGRLVALLSLPMVLISEAIAMGRQKGSRLIPSPRLFDGTTSWIERLLMVSALFFVAHTYGVWNWTMLILTGIGNTVRR